MDHRNKWFSYSYKPPLIVDVPLPCLITRGYHDFILSIGRTMAFSMENWWTLAEVIYHDIGSKCWWKHWLYPYQTVGLQQRVTFARVEFLEEVFVRISRGFRGAFYKKSWLIFTQLSICTWTHPRVPSAQSHFFEDWKHANAHFDLLSTNRNAGRHMTLTRICRGFTGFPANLPLLGNHNDVLHAIPWKTIFLHH